MLLQFRPLGTGDQDKLWHWLHVALWDPPPAGLRPKEVLQAPGVRIYAEDWGRPSDIGVVAQVSPWNYPMWMAIWKIAPALAAGDSIVLKPASATPLTTIRLAQLGIALEPEFQQRGYGRPLLLEALAAATRAGHRRVSLTVHPENPALDLYERCGFRKVERRNDYHLMVARVPSVPETSCRMGVVRVFRSRSNLRPSHPGRSG